MKPAKKSSEVQTDERRYDREMPNQADYDGDGGRTNQDKNNTRSYPAVGAGNPVTEDAGLASKWDDDDEEEDVGMTRQTARQRESNIEGRISKHE